ncbi:hypothetical protein WSM22_39580 [Cytophagales bacterium WSM2-2]|nr:hypothetical protein WSM22_39580 [Cytophagales bacterium WSM2-2]
MIKPIKHHVTVLLWIVVFILAVTTITTRVHGQALLNLKPDTLCVLNGHVNILLKAGTYDTIKTEELVQMYSSVFSQGKIISTCGFRFGENSNLRFYQTSLEKCTYNDGGLMTWKLIESFTDKIPQGQWIESKWEAHGGGYWYFVSLASCDKPGHFYNFIFFFVDGKLAFSVHEYVTDPLKASKEYSEPRDYLSYVYTNTHPSRYISLEEK